MLLDGRQERVMLLVARQRSVLMEHRQFGGKPYSYGHRLSTAIECIGACRATSSVAGPSRSERTWSSKSGKKAFTLELSFR